MKTTLILSQDDIHRIVESVGLDLLMDDLMERWTRAFANFDSRHMEIPPRQGFAYTDPQPGLLEWMPLLNNGSQALMKVVGYHPQNPTASGLPTILSSLSLFDATTGHLVALIDGTFLTAVRTGAASGVASRLLAKPDSATVGIVGCGAQSITQLHALSRYFEIQRVLHSDADAATAASFPQRARFLGDAIQFVSSSIQASLSDADILCVSTSVDVGAGPIFADTETKPHLHINAVGSDFPGKFELPKTLLQRSYVCPDCREQAVLEGECQQLDPAEIGDDICQIAQRDADGLPPLQNSVTVFDSTGWALEDYEAVKLLWEHACRLQLGTHVQIESINMDPKNPYERMAAGVTKGTPSSVAKAS